MKEELRLSAAVAYQSMQSVSVIERDWPADLAIRPYPQSATIDDEHQAKAFVLYVFYMLPSHTLSCETLSALASLSRCDRSFA
ncbi:MAG: hypothetical protein M3120_02630, partial [Pseudomonadota bacterium]|nr:hypothetical protein [Pseudomonadota bacterium]